MSPEKLVTVNGRRVLPAEAAATRLGCSLPTLRRMIAAGRLTPTRAFGRSWFDEAALDAMAAALESNAKASPSGCPGAGSAGRSE
jgi:excisionase family DNA binding protein